MPTTSALQVLVVYGSQYGNTQRVAQAIGEALAAEHVVRVVQAAEARALGDQHVDLLIVGAPTQMRGMRNLARSFLDSLEPARVAGVPVAAFDTRMGPRAGTLASDLIARRLRALGCRTVVAPESFVVTAIEGPLAPGELGRAASWARSAATAATAAAGRAATGV